VTDQQRVGIAVVFFLLGAVLTAAASVAAGALLMVAGLAALLWGRRAGDRHRR
jgi:hypothetical protein